MDVHPRTNITSIEYKSKPSALLGLVISNESGETTFYIEFEKILKSLGPIQRRGIEGQVS